MPHSSFDRTQNSSFECYTTGGKKVVATEQPFVIFHIPLARISGCAVAASTGQGNLEEPNADN
jgi:hypothetical protein